MGFHAWFYLRASTHQSKFNSFVATSTVSTVFHRVLNAPPYLIQLDSGAGFNNECGEMNALMTPDKIIANSLCQFCLLSALH